MEKDKFKTKVIFRFWKESKDVIAIFPEHTGDMNPYTCSSYEHIGQHGACNPRMIIENSRLAKSDEYADLKAELENHCGYDLVVIKRNRQEFIEERRKQLERVGE
jgi:hypothetical protein